MSSGEFIFVLDRSGSMGGVRITKALEALILLIQSLPVNSKFNIVSFGSNYSFLYKESVDYKNETVEETLNNIKKYTANLGGTNLFEPIEDILNKKCNYQFPRNIFIITDGEIYDTEALLNMIKESSNNTRIHSVGIGNGVSRYLVNEIAKAGKGASTFVSDNDCNFNTKIIQILQKASRPSFTDIKVDFESNNSCLLFSSPEISKISNLYEEESFNLF